ncbi:MAG: UDP-N-acetylglucosamine 1-carboxyvinyltransferase [Acidimicrobiales bacterium]
MADDVLRLRGGRPLDGRIAVRGAKNSVPKTMVAALLTDQPCSLTNAPAIVDVALCIELFRLLGVDAAAEGDRVAIQAAAPRSLGPERMASFHERSRIPILLSGPLLHRLGEAFLFPPGGCRIGMRPVDFHVSALEAFGAEITQVSEHTLRLSADRLHGASITFEYPSVGATEQALLTGVVAEGDTELRNCAIEPEVMDLIAVLQKMGALITVEADRVIRIQGQRRLRGFTHRALPDRLEAASWGCAALATGGRIAVQGARQLDLLTFLNTFRRAGGDFDIVDETITFHRGDRPLRPLAVETDVHPGFMTDWQSPLVTALTQAEGVSVVHETVYENRLGYTKALNALGANIQTFRECLGPTRCRFGFQNHVHSAVIVGPSKLEGGELEVPDLRGGFSYVIAALSAQGESAIHGIDIIDRGYEGFRSKLEALGVEVL